MRPFGGEIFGLELILDRYMPENCALFLGGPNGMVVLRLDRENSPLSIAAASRSRQLALAPATFEKMMEWARERNERASALELLERFRRYVEG